MSLLVDVTVRHLPTGIVGVVEKVYAAGEHPMSTCEVVRLSTGDELVLKSEDFEPLTAHEARVFEVLTATFRGIAVSTNKMATATGIPPSRIAPLFRSALSAALRLIP